MPTQRLAGVSLCAIVRDEMVNPAGGVIDFVHSTMPFLEAGVIVDTGSADGTREALGTLARIYPHLKIYDRAFDGYANSRNHALAQVRTSHALVLDADERLWPEDYARLATALQQDAWFYNVGFLSIVPDRPDEQQPGHNPRLFRMHPSLRYTHHVFESLVGSEEFLVDVTKRKETLNVDAPVMVKHFRPSAHARHAKCITWYGSINHFDPDEIRTAAPERDRPHFEDWKRINHKRFLYPMVHVTGGDNPIKALAVSHGYGLRPGDRTGD